MPSTPKPQLMSTMIAVAGAAATFVALYTVFQAMQRKPPRRRKIVKETIQEEDIIKEVEEEKRNERSVLMEMKEAASQDSGIASPKTTPQNHKEEIHPQVLCAVSNSFHNELSSIRTPCRPENSSSLYVESSKLVDDMVSSACQLPFEDFLEDSTSISFVQGSISLCEQMAKLQLEGSLEVFDVPAQDKPGVILLAKETSVLQVSDQEEKVADKEQQVVTSVPEVAMEKQEVASSEVQQVTSSEVEVVTETRKNNNTAVIRGSGDEGNNNVKDTVEAVQQNHRTSYDGDSNSEGSADSGKGGSDGGGSNPVVMIPPFVHQFELPADLCGRLIGKQGSYVKQIKIHTGATVTVRPHSVDPNLKMVLVVGHHDDVKKALQQIRQRFPPKQYPKVTLTQADRVVSTVGVSSAHQFGYLNIPLGGPCEVRISCIASGNHYFLQLGTQHTYTMLERLEYSMAVTYTNGPGVPDLPSPVQVGAICAAPMGSLWYRAVVEAVHENDEVQIKYVDYGDTQRFPVTQLKQIRSDFMDLAFQAIECYLAKVEPFGEDWSAASIDYLRSLLSAEGVTVLATVVGYAHNGIALVDLHINLNDSAQPLSVADELVRLCHARWSNVPHLSPVEVTFNSSDFPQLSSSGLPQHAC